VPKIKYEDINFSPQKMAIIDAANRIIAEYARQGYTLTLRQTYYQFVARDLLPQSWADANGVVNRPESYNKLGTIINDGRMAGLIDWLAIVDRGRNSYANRHWDKPSSIIKDTINQYAIDKWANQKNYVEVWVEKEALEDVLHHACQPMDVRYFACKGYTSQSAMWEASQRLLRKIEAGKEVHIVHLGDHDPSGIDMSRDIFSRLSLFVGTKVHVMRIALNMVQIQRYNPPPNPAKTTDSRYADYRAKYGDESGELDALEPTILVDLIERAVGQFRDEKLWQEACDQERKGQRTLETLHEKFPQVVQFLRTQK
jgi:hypothetical protein